MFLPLLFNLSIKREAVFGPWNIFIGHFYYFFMMVWLIVFEKYDAIGASQVFFALKETEIQIFKISILTKSAKLILRKYKIQEKFEISSNNI